MTSVNHIQGKNKSITQEDGMSTGRPGVRELMGHERCALGMLRLESCPRGKGDVVLERDQWGRCELCVQCGYLRDLQDIVEVEPQRAHG